MVATRTGPAKSRLPKFDLEEAKAVFVLGRRPDCPENWEVHDGGGRVHVQLKENTRERNERGSRKSVGSSREKMGAMFMCVCLC